MSRCKRLLPLLVTLIVAACGEGVGPPDSLGPPSEDPSQLGTIVGSGVDDAAMHVLRHDLRMATEDGEPLDQARITAAAGAPLDAYSLSFWVTRGEPTTVQINYLGHEVAGPFLKFHVPSNGLTRRPDGSSIAIGDSVRIRIAIDPSAFHLTFEPSGLEFSSDSPVQLEVWYGEADPDLDGDGIVDEHDKALQTSLGLWFQQEQANPWYRIIGLHDPNRMWLKTYLFHFSNYAASW